MFTINDSVGVVGVRLEAQQGERIGFTLPRLSLNASPTSPRKGRCNGTRGDQPSVTSAQSDTSRPPNDCPPHPALLIRNGEAGTWGCTLRPKVKRQEVEMSQLSQPKEIPVRMRSRTLLCPYISGRV